jgi:hypothetical protein
MQPNLEFEFRYIGRPIIPIVARVGSYQTGFSALIDTGADVTLLDEMIASQLGLQIDGLPRARVLGVGGGTWDVSLAEVTLNLLLEPDLEATLQVAFVPEISLTVGNLLGRDVLAFFDFGLSHADEIRTEALS